MSQQNSAAKTKPSPLVLNDDGAIGEVNDFDLKSPLKRGTNQTSTNKQ